MQMAVKIHAEYPGYVIPADELPLIFNKILLDIHLAAVRSYIAKEIVDARQSERNWRCADKENP